MKTTYYKAVTAYKLLQAAKLNKMTAEEQIALVKALRPLRNVSEEYDTFIKESVKKLAPEGWDDMQESLQGLENLKGEELNAKLADPDVKAALKARDGYNAKIIELDRDESAKEVELSFSPLSETAVGHLLASNELTAEESLALLDLLAAPESTETPEPENK